MTSFVDQTVAEAEHRVIFLCCEKASNIDRVSVSPEDFFDPRWKEAMRALRELHLEHGDDVDSLTLMDRLTGRVPKLGHADLVNISADPMLIHRYSDIVREAACKRRLRLGLSEVISELETGLSAEDGLSKASKVLMDATMGQADGALSIGDIVRNRFLEIAELADRVAKGDTSATGIGTGIDRLDSVLGGLQAGIVTLLAARPSMGKSTLSLNITNAASKAGVGVHVFSLEDTRDAYADRVLSLGGRVSPDKIRGLNMSSMDLGSIRTAGERIQGRKGWIVDDRSGVTAEEIVRCVRRRANDNGTKLVVVDYIQLLRGERGQGKRELLDHAINVFGDAAKRDRMAYLVLSQLNRGLESREDKRPMLSDLKESGTLEERAKAVIMLYRPFVYGQGSESEIEIIVRKNSNGRTGIVKAVWEPERMRIRGE